MTLRREGGSPAAGPRYRWLEPEPVPAARVAELERALGLPADVCGILLRRGYGDVRAARAFLRPDPGSLHSPRLLPDAEKAASRIERAIGEGEIVLVHGDYDADGMCAAALLARGLADLGGRVEAFVPHRTRDGYDLGEAGLRRARELGARLIVTADCGVSALRAVADARASGIDVVVTDHHRPGPKLPSAVAVVNPSCERSSYPFRGLAGVGVAFKLLALLFSRAGYPEGRLNQHLDLVALGTVADLAPLVDENRVCVRMGLRALQRTRKVGLRALMEVAGLRPSEGLTAAELGYVLGPRLNAVGRVGAAADGLRLLLTDDAGEAGELARRLELENRRRRAADREVVEAAEKRLREEYAPDRDRVVVLWGEGWHPGVLGIAASRIAERLHRPTVLLSFEGEVGRGSARSIEGFHLVRALEACGSALERYGGHSMAAGLDIRRDRLDEFVACLTTYAAERLAGEDLGPELRIDLVLPLGAVTGDFHRRLRYLAPHGVGNPRPVLMAPGVKVEDLHRVGREGQHLRATLRSGTAGLRAIGFGLGDREGELRGSDRWDAAFELEEDRWRGGTRLSARLLDLRPGSA